ncbi:hypothetical protein GGR56DRAFT_679610 [Xylariaceae sp. FL0804]|nr:hypothetical protein GGR56DRAFT_679610 [Xylariaceae sp. FL0804]
MGVNNKHNKTDSGVFMDVNSGVNVNGMIFTVDRLTEMGRELAEARAAREFPATTAPGYNPQATVDDYDNLVRLREARAGASQVDSPGDSVAALMVEITRSIQERDALDGETAATANINARMSGFANGVMAENNIYQLVRHAVHSVIQSGNTSNVPGVDMAGVINDIHDVLDDLASRGESGVTEANVEMVLEHVFRMIDGALEGQVGNMNNIAFNMNGALHGHADNINNIASNMATTQQTIADAQQAQVNRLDAVTTAANQAHMAQVNAITGHVHAIDSHVRAMGTNVNAMGSLLNATNGNVTSLNANIGLMQTIVNMIPDLVARAVAEILPGLIHNGVHAAITDDLVARLEVIILASHAARTRRGFVNKLGVFTSEENKEGSEKKTSGKKGGVFKKFFGFFKKGGDRGNDGGASGAGLAC